MRQHQPTRIQEPPQAFQEPDFYDEPEPYPEPRDRYRDRDPDPYLEPRDRYRDRDLDRDLDPYPEPRDRYRDRERRGDPYRDRDRDRMHGPSADAIGRTIQVVTGLISLIFLLHIVFVVTGANQSNDFVGFVYSVAKIFVFGLGDVFTPNDATFGVILNYGLASLIYLFLGRIVARALRR